jgi:hypothetical protein
MTPDQERKLAAWLHDNAEAPRNPPPAQPRKTHPRARGASRPRFPVTITHLPVVRCAICQDTMAHQPGRANDALTAHYQRKHPAALGL